MKGPHRKQIAKALQDFLDHGVFGISKNSELVTVSFPVHELDQFVSALGFEARIMIREHETKSAVGEVRDEGGDEWYRNREGQPESIVPKDES